MKLSTVIETLVVRPLWDGWEDRDVKGGYTSDLLSDVMANATEDEILITIQAHKNTIAVAQLKDMAAVLICSNRPVDEAMLSTAQEENIPILITSDNQYTASYKLHQALSQ
ncbi:MAG: hypothetical protein MI717_02005 [Spirochaetales bacterium]|nr:hypothetical protein [Spirochaetales bacterium]